MAWKIQEKHSAKNLENIRKIARKTLFFRHLYLENPGKIRNFTITVKVREHDNTA